jgi:hypothetical protein
MNNSPNLKRYAYLAVLFLATTGFVAAGPVFSFTGVSNNSVTNTLIGETQLSVEVDNAGGGQVWFKFTNSGPDPSSITAIYFDDGPAGTGTLTSLASYAYSGAGISFATGAAPSDLPAGNTLSPAFTTTAGLSAGSTVPPPQNGVNPGEWLTIYANLANTSTYDDVLDALNNGALRIGLHVQAFANGGSESFVNTPNPVVPVPSSVLLAAIGFGAVRLLSRRSFALI